jgi:adenylate cyclase
MIPRIKSFGTKLLLLLVLVVAVAQLATWRIVSRFHFAQARDLVDQELQRSALTFRRVVDDRRQLLASVALAAARDFEIKKLFASDDPATLASGLESLQLASQADVVLAIALDGSVMAATSATLQASDVFPSLVAEADANPAPNPTATGFGYLGGQLHSLILAPIQTPDIVAWVALGFQIDSQLAQNLKEQTGVELTFFDHDGQRLATTLSPAPAAALARAFPGLRDARESVTLPLGEETALVAVRPFAAGPGRGATLVLQYSLDEKLRPARESERWLFAVASGTLLLAIFVSRAFARHLSRPIVALVGHARRIARGDYSVRNKTYRSDELGRLSEAFDQMAAGLAERDLVRDLLDKNVSPEVAAHLVRDGAALGGEEREVTILFADLRGFTTMSEKFSPHELLTLLNRYLDRMSAEIERQGGVIDKFIGDAIMALFGAPVDQADAADRALAAGLAMEQALKELNAELAAEGRAPLALGIGINTARVVAGNIGSHRRLNYSVIGDGVNVAARLQSLTRTPDYATNLITSATTLAALRQRDRVAARPLGHLQVKGRAEPVEIFAIAPQALEARAIS